MLPAPNLDDRRFQQLVDDAKRHVGARCPEWTDHNVSDPGVTLIETFAFMMDELFYRLNRVPDRLHLAFLDLIGVTRHAPTPARVDVLFRLSAPRPAPVVVPAGAEVGTVRTELEEAVAFRTEGDLAMPPRRLLHVGSGDPVAVRAVRGADALPGEGDFTAFGAIPSPGDAVLFGLDDAAPSCLVGLDLRCAVSGIGVDPTDPPWEWQAWTGGGGWQTCRVLSDGTGGFNQDGRVEVLLPETHEASVVGATRAGWIRCIVQAASRPGQPAYTSSPLIHGAAASVIGGMAAAVHAEPRDAEVLGLSEGVPGQVFAVESTPVLADGTALRIESASGSGWDDWLEVDGFAGRSDEERVFTVDRASGEVRFPPAVREPDGSLTTYGAVPPAGAPLRITGYRVGGGARGNVAAGAIEVLRTTVPFVRSVDNPAPASGGVDAETVDEARARGALALHTRDRAVTAQDYEQLAKAARPGVARVHCVPVTDGTAPAVRVLVVPAVAPRADGHTEFADLLPAPELLAGIAEELEVRRVAGSRVIVEPPFYRGVTVVARLVADRRSASHEIEAAAVRAIHRHLDPVRGGLAGSGWPFGRPVLAGELHAVLQSVPGVELVEDLKLWEADPVTGVRAGDSAVRIPLDAHALVHSYRPSVRVRKGL